MTEIRFTWNEAKNVANQKKHGISFEEAARVFLDPLHLSVPDRIEDREQRWQTLGLVGGVMILLVAHTATEERAGNQLTEVVRIISARPATRKERMRYENGSLYP